MRYSRTTCFQDKLLIPPDCFHVELMVWFEHTADWLQISCDTISLHQHCGCRLDCHDIITQIHFKRSESVLCGFQRPFSFSVGNSATPTSSGRYPASGVPDWIWTNDLTIKRRVLFHLSYRDILTIFETDARHTPHDIFTSSLACRTNKQHIRLRYYFKSYDLTTRQFDYFVMLQHNRLLVYYATCSFSTYATSVWMQGKESNLQSSDNESDKLPLLYPAI